MSRLPNPGGDEGQWGDILNDYLSQAHNADGKLKDNVVASSTIAPSAVTSTAIAPSAVTAAAIKDGSITPTLLSADIQAKLSVDYAVVGHTHAIADTTGLQAALDDKASVNDLDTSVGEVKAVTDTITLAGQALISAADPVEQRKEMEVAILGDWSTSRERSVSMRPSLADTPTSVVWANTMDPSITNPVYYSISKTGIGSNTTGWDGQDDPTFEFGYAENTYATGNGGSNDLELHTGLKPGGDAQAARWPFIMGWTMTGDRFDLIGYGGEGDYACLIEINGLLLDDRLLYSGLGIDAWRLSLVFPSSATRTIRIWNGMGRVSGVYVATGQSVTKPTALGRRVAIIGDSYANGAGTSSAWPNQGTNGTETFAPLLGRALSTRAPLLAGIGGTGWVAGGDTNAYYTRIPSVLSWNPDVLIFSGSINDNGYSPSAIQAAVESALESCVSVEQVFVLWTPPNESNYWYSFRDAVKAGTLAQGRKFIDLTGVMTGNGSASNQIGDGTNDFFRMSDNTHPTFAGHRALFRRALALIGENF